MARKSPEQTAIEGLIRASSEARSQIGSKVCQLKRTLSIPMRISDSLRHKPGMMMGGTLLAGLATSLLLGGKRKPKSEAKKGLTKKVFSLILTGAQPLAKVWLSRKLRQWAATMLHRQQAAHPPHSPFEIKPAENTSNVRPPGP